MHTFSPTQTLFSLLLHLDILSVYIALDLYKRQRKIYKLTDIIITPYIYSKKLSNKLSEMCSIPHEEILPQNIFTSPSFLPL